MAPASLPVCACHYVIELDQMTRLQATREDDVTVSSTSVIGVKAIQTSVAGQTSKEEDFRDFCLHAHGFISSYNDGKLMISLYYTVE